MLKIRKAKKADHTGIWNILKPVIRRGDVFAYSPDSTKKEMIDYWCGDDKYTYVVEDEGEIAGSFFIRDNQPGSGSHIANAGYVAASTKSGKGIGKLMCEFSLAEAKRLGYSAMQFNLVVKSNEKAVKIWKDCGFEIIGEIPGAFKAGENFVNAYIMFRQL